MMNSLLQDMRFALRSFRAAPGFTATAIVVLALGIGANTAIFSVVEAVLLRPLPYRDADRLVLLWHRARGSPDRIRIPAPDIAEYEQRSRAFEDFAFGTNIANASLGRADGSRHIRVGLVTHNFFSVLGAESALGRTFVPGETILPPEAFEDTAFAVPPGVLLLSHGLWMSRFGGDPEVIGRSAVLNGNPYRIVGVMPAGFEVILPTGTGLSSDADAWTPLRIDLSRFARDEGEWRDQDSNNTGVAIGRLRSGVSLEEARTEMSAIAGAQRREIAFYEEAGLRIEVAPMHQEVVAHVDRALWILLGAVGLVLLIACLNVANLLLARAVGRRREMAVRSALGADRRRLARQVLTESAVLAASGCATGLVVAYWGIDLLSALSPETLPRQAAIGLNGRVLLFSAGAAAVVALLFGSAPALLLSSVGNGETLGQRGAGGTGQRSLVRRALVTVEVALSLVLLIGTGLMLQSFVRLQQVHPGFEPEGLVTFRVTLPGGTVGGPGARARFMSRVEDRIRSLPGVQAVGLAGGLPLSGEHWTQPYGLPGQPEEEWARNEANFRVITSGYFRAMGTRLLAGRPFSEREDTLEERRVAIVDAELARRIAPAGSAVGRRLGFPLDGSPIQAEVVGVVEQIRYESLQRPGRPTIYVPYRQEASRTVGVAVRAGGDPALLIGPIRREFAGLEAGVPIPVYDFRPMEAYVAGAMAQTRFALALIGLFAGIAVLLAWVGLYGVISYAVNERRREIAIRVSVGAREEEIVRHFVRSGMTLVATGLAAGAVLAAAASRALSALLFGISGLDPATYIAVAALLAAISLLACYLPARRGSRAQPMEALCRE